MGLIRARALVLFAIPLREKDRIVTFLTEEAGTKRGVARGARKLQSAYASVLEPMTEVNVVFFERENRDLFRVDSIDLVRSSFPLADELSRALLLSAMAEALATFVSDSDPSEKFFRLARHCLDALFADVDTRQVAVYFDLWMLHLSGVFPAIAECSSCGARFPAGEIYLDETVPGFMDRRCAKAGAVRVSSSAAAGIRAILTRRVPDIALPPAASVEIARVAGRLRRNFLGHELKSQNVLTEIFG